MSSLPATLKVTFPMDVQIPARVPGVDPTRSRAASSAFERFRAQSAAVLGPSGTVVPVRDPRIIEAPAPSLFRQPRDVTDGGSDKGGQLQAGYRFCSLALPASALPEFGIERPENVEDAAVVYVDRILRSEDGAVVTQSIELAKPAQDEHACDSETCPACRDPKVSAKAPRKPKARLVRDLSAFGI